MVNRHGNSRRKLLKTIGATGSLLTVGTGQVLAADTGEEYPMVSGEIYNGSVQEIASYTGGFSGIPGVAKHPSQDRVAFISPYGEGALDLFIAEGIQSPNDKADAVYRITDAPEAGVYAPEWLQGNHLAFQQNFTRYSVNIPQNYLIEEKTVLDEDVTENKTVRPAFSIPNLPKVPNSIPFNLCVPFGRSKWCVQADDLAIGQPKDCNSGMTPPLASATAHIQKEVLGLGGWDVETDIQMWVGVEEDLNGVWFGAPDGECARYQIDPPDPTAAVDDIVDSLNQAGDDAAEWIDDHGGPNKGTHANDFLVLVVLLIIALIIIAGSATGTWG
ncbi:hypothetical protein [Natrinema salaciae]|uniref:hypothetical protein n=1 Tax=Natrinema salaciae TaxID=1186196 RepID=UPI001113A5F1|nr:hypothetical protein [Natrinema salaciae]